MDVHNFEFPILEDNGTPVLHLLSSVDDLLGHLYSDQPWNSVYYPVIRDSSGYSSSEKGWSQRYCWKLNLWVQRLIRVANVMAALR